MAKAADPQVALKSDACQRWRIEVTGAVQGVGFRPYAHRLASSEGLSGFALNSIQGATVEIEGAVESVKRFLQRLELELAPPARIETRSLRELPVEGSEGFAIMPSVTEGAGAAFVLPDLATCPECLADISDPQNRRYLYPFTTCVHCGPRFSIMASVPYDRARTTMAGFLMCEPCQAEYQDPASRRFHAETIACPDCGPRLSLWNAAGEAMSSGHGALTGAADAIREGKVVALKGLGGFQLLVDARNEVAVQALRKRKHRPSKPFAVMTGTLQQAEALARISPDEALLLTSPARPIVLLAARGETGAIASCVAPRNPLIGIMLPATPLHHILMDQLGVPIVATSGNISDEPVLSDECEAIEKLAGVADLFLVHNRPILHPVDDSVVRHIAGAETTLRMARGYAPLSLTWNSARSGVALGGHQKDAVAVCTREQIILGPHIGDLQGAATRAALKRSVERLTTLYRVEPDAVACDAHPDFYSTRLAERLGPPVVRVSHHLAHVRAGQLDNGLEGDVLGFAWDGTGYGDDGTIRGSECLAVKGDRYRRVAHFLAFRLPGGEAAILEPRRAALGALYATYGEAAFSMTSSPVIEAFGPGELDIVATMLRRGVNAPLASSAGRLFDAVSAILGICQRSGYEGEAAMAVEFAADRADKAETLPAFLIGDGSPAIVDWRPVIAALAEALARGARVEDLAKAFHRSLAGLIVAIARKAGIRQVVLTGGCFQNALLACEATDRLEEAGFSVYRHRRIPPNDGGLAAGQAACLSRPMIEETM